MSRRAIELLIYAFLAAGMFSLCVFVDFYLGAAFYGMLCAFFCVMSAIQKRDAA